MPGKPTNTWNHFEYHGIMNMLSNRLKFPRKDKYLAKAIKTDNFKDSKSKITYNKVILLGICFVGYRGKYK